MHDILVFLFAMTGGLTVSGIVANVYRLISRPIGDMRKTNLYWVVMVLAGPSVLFENATQSLRIKKCSATAWGLALAISLYWSFAIGLLGLNFYIAI